MVAWNEALQRAIILCKVNVGELIKFKQILIPIEMRENGNGQKRERETESKGESNLCVFAWNSNTFQHPCYELCVIWGELFDGIESHHTGYGKRQRTADVRRKSSTLFEIVEILFGIQKQIWKSIEIV